MKSSKGDPMRLRRTLFWLLIWGMTFAYIEASVVVYLRQIYYPDGFHFPVIIAETSIVITEMLRELATLVIIWTTATLTYERHQSKIAAFLLLFGIWDIFYYVFLKLLLEWPESLMTWDILFLMPTPWAGPVWAPLLVSITIVYAGVAVLNENDKGLFHPFNKRFIGVELLAALMIIVSFLIPGHSVITQRIPSDFPWYLFGSGYIIALVTFLIRSYRHRR